MEAKLSFTDNNNHDEAMHQLVAYYTGLTSKTGLNGGKQASAKRINDTLPFSTSCHGNYHTSTKNNISLVYTQQMC